MVIEGANSSPKMFGLFLYRYRWKGYFCQGNGPERYNGLTFMLMKIYIFRFDLERFPLIFHYVKYARIRVFSEPHILAYGQNLRLFSLYRNMRITENSHSGIFYAVVNNLSFWFNNLTYRRNVAQFGTICTV